MYKALLFFVFCLVLCATASAQKRESGMASSVGVPRHYSAAPNRDTIPVVLMMVDTCAQHNTLRTVKGYLTLRAEVSAAPNEAVYGFTDDGRTWIVDKILNQNKVPFTAKYLKSLKWPSTAKEGCYQVFDWVRLK